MNPSKIERFKHRRPLRLWICALLSIIITLLILGGLTALGFGVFEERNWLWWALGAFGAVVILSLGFMIGSARVNCRVCTNPLMLEKGCNKHRSATRFMGLSYTLGSAIPAVFTGTCKCMYCGEPNFIWVSNRKIRKHATAKPKPAPAPTAPGFTPLSHQSGFPQQTNQNLPTHRHLDQAPPQAPLPEQLGNPNAS